LLFNFVSGLLLMITSFVLDALEDTAELNRTLKWFYRLLPAFCLGDGLAQLSFCSEGRDCPVFSIGEGFSVEIQRPLAWDVAGLDLLFLAGHAAAYFLLALLVEHLRTFPACAALLERAPDPGDRGAAEEEEDPDVAAEAKRVAAGGAAGEVVVLAALRKVYRGPAGPKVAVRALSFGIGRGEASPGRHCHFGRK
jgi:ATP-binding cassette subfamily A (ABC1) protein 1